MADVMTKEQRSRTMAAIHSKDTKPEVFLRKLLFSKGYRFRKNAKGLPGHPDIWLRKWNTVVFVNGCFWHAHKDCKGFRMPSSNLEFWTGKLERNIARDLERKAQYEELGIKELVVWECTIHSMKRHPEVQEEKLAEIAAFFEGEEQYKEI